MAISACKDCCASNWRSSSIDSTGTLLICVNGHYNFEAGSGGGTVKTGKVKVTGQSAIGNGATAIGRKK